MLAVARSVLILGVAAHAQLALAHVPLAEYGSIPVGGGECLRQIGAHHVAADGLKHLDVDDIGHVVAKANARMVDEVDALNGFHVHRQQVGYGGVRVVDAYHHAP